METPAPRLPAHGARVQPGDLCSALFLSRVPRDLQVFRAADAGKAPLDKPKFAGMNSS